MNAYFRERELLVERLAEQGIRDSRVLAAMGRVPRHAFCLPGDEPRAYEDDVLPLTHGATLSQPFVVAAMIEALELKGGERVLDVGSGSGYTTALLCELAGSVSAVEIDAGLAATAQAQLEALGYRNFRMQRGDGWQGWLEYFPYDAILVSAAVPNAPPALLDQLAPGGRMVLPVGGATQVLRVIESNEESGAMSTRDGLAVRFVPLVRADSDNS